MLDNERKDFAELLSDVYSAYGKDVSGFVLNAFWESLKRFDFHAVARAFSAHYSNPDNGQFAPKPGDIVRIIDGGSGDRALMAWVKVDKAIRRVGPYQSVVFDDPIIHAVLDDMGGWIALNSTPSEKDLEFRQNEFLKRYRGYLITGRVPDYQPKLIGIADMDNQLRNVRTDKPVLIGDTKRAMQVLTSGKGTGLKIVKSDQYLQSVVKKIGVANE